MSKSTKEIRKLIKEAKRQGWREKAKKKGVALYPPNNEDDFVMLHMTADGSRSFDNALSQMRKLGFEWKGR